MKDSYLRSKEVLSPDRDNLSGVADDRPPVRKGTCANDQRIYEQGSCFLPPPELGTPIAFMISTFNCAPETRSKHARPVCFFHDMLWSRVSSCGLLALEEVVSALDICNVLPRLLKWENGRKRLTHSVTFAVALTEPT